MPALLGSVLDMAGSTAAPDLHAPGRRAPVQRASDHAVAATYFLSRRPLERANS